MNSPVSSSVKSWDLSGHEVSYYIGSSLGWEPDKTEPVSGCADTTSSLEVFANQAQYQMKVFTDNKNVSHLIQNWISDEVACKVF